MKTTASKRKAALPKAAATQAPRRSSLTALPAPRQGFESDSELKPGVSVGPPTRTELAASALDLAGDLAKSGISSGVHLLRGVVSRLPGA